MTLRTKIYLYVIIISFFFGWSNENSVVTSVVDDARNFEFFFNYRSFAASLSVGYTVVLLGEIYLYFKNKKSGRES